MIAPLQKYLRRLLKRPKLVAIYAYRYDQQLIPDMVKNLNFVDEFIAHDDSQNNAIWYDEGAIRTSLIERARAAGADWVICIDPDERFEKGAGKQIRNLIANKRKVIYGFPFCELFSPLAFRTDGLWGQKKKWVLFPLLPDQQFMNQPLHSAWWPQNADYEYVMTDIRLYHLKMINKDHREQRRRIYNTVDSEKKFQPIGYDYLIDEEGMIMQSIEPGREYHPRYSAFEFSVIP